MAEALSVSGSCLCGGVRFSAGLPSLFCAHCHCAMCRRAHGAGYVTWFGVSRDALCIVSGKELLVHYASSDHGTRSFCGRCGSTLFFETKHHPNRVDIALANAAEPIDRAPQIHVHYDDRADWVSVGDKLPHLGGETGLQPVSE